MEGGASRSVLLLEGLDLVDDGIGSKSEEKSTDGAMVFVDENLPELRVLRVMPVYLDGRSLEEVCELVLSRKRP